MLTKNNTDIETISRNHVSVGGQQIPCTWDAHGSHVNHDDLRRARTAGLANWSDEEIADLAYHAETRMNETYTKAYDIVVYEGFNQDIIRVLDSIRMDNDAAANAYAEQHYADQEWYVIDANGDNING